jgi:hypothetical protein
LAQHDFEAPTRYHNSGRRLKKIKNGMFRKKKWNNVVKNNHKGSIEAPGI